jgi:sugar phosphate isomerase/epimerase
VVGPYQGAGAFVETARQCGFRAVTFPLGHGDDPGEIDRLVQALGDADIRIAEVGAWNNNPLSLDREEKRRSIENCIGQLELAEHVGAVCCVNVAGSHGPRWDGPWADSFSAEVFDEAVETVQPILDAVKPARTFYTLETMPWMIPHSAGSYRALLDAVNRPGFAVHLDTVNLISSPERYYCSAALTDECFDTLGHAIKSIHVKDIKLDTRLTVHLDECLVGQGGYDLRRFLRRAAELPGDTPVLVEHINNQQDYADSVRFLHKLLGEM